MAWTVEKRQRYSQVTIKSSRGDTRETVVIWLLDYGPVHQDGGGRAKAGR